MRRLTCQQVLDHLEDYLDEEARVELVAEVEQHVGVCGHCRIEIDTLRHTIRIFKPDREIVLPPTLAERLQRALEGAYRLGPGLESGSES